MPAWMEIWIEWCCSDRQEIARMVGYPSHTPGLTGGWARGTGFWDDQEAAADNQLAMAVDQAVDALPGPLRDAIHWVAGMQTVRPIPDGSEAFADAVSLVRSAVLAKGFCL